MEINPGTKHTSSGDKFSFPATIQEYSDKFEFGCVTTPGSPNSPADHLFFNGKLLPHVFRINQTSSHNFSYSRSTSRTSSISSSKDSLMSSRSNSTNSRSSNCSSARTSTSTEASERKTRTSSLDGNIIPGRTSFRKERSQYQYYGSSQRWQLMAAVPVLKHQGSRVRRVDQAVNLERKGSKKLRGCDDGKNRVSGKSWFGQRILKTFVSACKEWHAIETS